MTGNEIFKGIQRLFLGMHQFL